MSPEHEELVERARRYFPPPPNPVMPVDTRLVQALANAVEDLSSRNEHLENAVDTLVSAIERAVGSTEKEDSQETKLEGTE